MLIKPKMIDMKIIFILTALVSFSTTVVAQQEGTDQKLVPKEFAIPPSPLFDLMGAAPSRVVKSADIKDFKVDWSFRNWRINPNLAVQGQPIWELFYNRKNLSKYQNASYLARTLASTDVSLGTINSETNDRRIGAAVKFNVYKQKDPLLVKDLYKELLTSFDEELKTLKANEKNLLNVLDSVTQPNDIKKYKAQLIENDSKLTSFYNRRKEALIEKSKEVIIDNWNASFIDVAVGQIKTYETDSAGSFRKLKLNRNTGKAMWINYGLKLGKRAMLTGLIRSTYYEEEVTFMLKNNITGDEVQEKTIADNKLLSVGFNIRYGGPVYNFFIEFAKESKTFKTPIEALNEAFKAPNEKSVITNTVKWDTVDPYNISFGGDWRIGRNLVLNYGLRLIMNKNFKTTSVLPIANISCMMR
jgi:hypothetical protein